MSNNNDPFVSLDDNELDGVAGGAARVAAGGSSGTNDQVMQALTAITGSATVGAAF